MDTTTILIASMAAALLAVGGFFALYAHKTRKRLDHQASLIKNFQHTQNNDRLRLIESKLNPHLFKNILNSIQSHAYQTYFALDKLANVLDYILYDSRNRNVAPKEEIQFALDLIEINKIKLSPLFELQVKLKINEDDPFYTQKLLAPLISIDLIENAFKHADLQSQQSYIKIIFEFDKGVFGLTVSNKISIETPLQKDRGGIGAETFEQRLKLIYPDHHQLSRIKQGDQYIAHLKINLREYKNQMHPA